LKTNLVNEKNAEIKQFQEELKIKFRRRSKTLQMPSLLANHKDSAILKH